MVKLSPTFSGTTGKVNFQGTGKRTFPGIDSDLKAAIEAAARDYAGGVSVFAGKERHTAVKNGRRYETPNHTLGYAADTALYDANGRLLAPIGDPRSFPAYADWDKLVYDKMMQINPAKAKLMRGGVYFKGAPYPGDAEHLDVTPNADRPANGEIATGFNAKNTFGMHPGLPGRLPGLEESYKIQSHIDNASPISDYRNAPAPQSIMDRVGDFARQYDPIGGVISLTNKFGDIFSGREPVPGAPSAPPAQSPQTLGPSQISGGDRRMDGPSSYATAPGAVQRGPALASPSSSFSGDDRFSDSTFSPSTYSPYNSDRYGTGITGAPISDYRAPPSPTASAYRGPGDVGSLAYSINTGQLDPTYGMTTPTTPAATATPTTPAPGTAGVGKPGEFGAGGVAGIGPQTVPAAISPRAPVAGAPKTPKAKGPQMRQVSQPSYSGPAPGSAVMQGGKVVGAVSPYGTTYTPSFAPNTPVYQDHYQVGTIGPGMGMQAQSLPIMQRIGAYLSSMGNNPLGGYQSSDSKAYGHQVYGTMNYGGSGGASLGGGDTHRAL